MIAALIALVVGPRKTFTVLREVPVVVTFLLVLVAPVLVGFAASG